MRRRLTVQIIHLVISTTMATGEKKRKTEGLEGAGQVVKEQRQQPLRCHGVMGEGPPPPHPRRHQSAHEAAKSRNSLARRKLRTEIGGGCKLRSV